MANAQRPVRILLVEHDEVDRRTLVRLLAETSSEVTLAGTMRDALDLLGRERFDAVLLDLDPADSDGLRGLAAVQKADISLPVIVCGGTADHDLALQALQCGAQDYLPKGRLDGDLLYRAVCYAIERKRMEQVIRHLAYYDSLTGVPNRLLLQDRLALDVARARRHGRHIAVLYLDVDNFKSVNDSLGHAAGDIALVRFADRLTDSVRASDTVARLGGDEFAILLGDLDRPHDAAVAARKVLANLRRPFQVDGRELSISASIGIAVWPDDGHTVDQLLRAADAAMYAAKQQGTDEYRFHAAAMNVTSDRRAQLAAEMRCALDRNEFLLHYQPIVDVRCGTVQATEALIRWSRPGGQVLGPGEFVPEAEKTRAIIPIGEWVLREACRQSEEWRLGGYPDVRVTVNLSACQLNERGLPHAVSHALEQFHTAPCHLGVEVTEGAAMVNESRALATLRALHEMNVHISLDDFGTGCASLTHLRKLPLDALKIDRSFVAGLPRLRENAEIVRGIVSMAHGLGKEVVAEGVETLEQLEFLRETGCDQMQGYYFGRPMHAGAAGRFLFRESREIRVASG